MTKYNQEMLSWCLYDWANSAFATTIMAAALPVFYSKVAAGALSPHLASSYWGYTNTMAMIMIAVMSPILGIIADRRGKRKNFLLKFALLGILSTSLLIGVGEGDWKWVSLLYILGRLGFCCGNVFYDSLLPFVAEKENFDYVSSLGYAFGYVGGGLLLILNLIMIIKPRLFGLPNPVWGFRLSFFSVSIWWAVFSIPLFLYVTEPPFLQMKGNNRVSLSQGLDWLYQKFRQMRQYPQIWKFILAYWLYNDGIGTIIIMATIFGAEIGIGTNHLIGAILLVQFLGAPATLFFSRMTRVLETKKCILIGLAVYTMIAVAGYFMRKPIHFWLLAIMVACVQGGCQSLSRSFFGKMIPKSQSAEFFAFYDVSTKFAGIIGPAVFGLIGQVLGSSRYGILSLVIFFLLGGFFLNQVQPQGNQAGSSPL